MNRPRILIADDHPMIRNGLKEILAEEFDGAQILEADDASSTLTTLEKHPADLAIVDLNMPGRSGLDMVQEIRRNAPSTAVLVFSVHGENTFAVRAFRAGASGYLTKGANMAEIKTAARTLLEGKRYISPAVADLLAVELGSPADGTGHEQLSDREFQVLRLFGRGRTNKQVSDELHLSPKTVSTYRERILEKLRLQTTAELVRYAVTNGLD